MNSDEALAGARANVAAPETERLAQLLDDPVVRARLSEVLHEEFVSQGATPSFWQRLGLLIASIGSALVMLLAFFIPSIQDQWDRYQLRSEQLEKNGKPSEARTVLEQLLALEPTDTEVRQQLARLQQHTAGVRSPTRRK